MNAAFFIVFLTLFTLFYYSDPFAQLSLIGLHILALIFLYRKRMNMRWCFYEDCNREEQQRLKLTSMLISASGYQMGKRGKVRKKTIFALSAVDSAFSYAYECKPCL